jgi:hypothetical protein
MSMMQVKHQIYCIFLFTVLLGFLSLNFCAVNLLGNNSISSKLYEAVQEYLAKYVRRFQDGHLRTHIPTVELSPTQTHTHTHTHTHTQFGSYPLLLC